MAFPEPLPAEPKKSRTGIIIAVVVVVLCCCCLAVLIGGYAMRESIMALYNSM